MATTATEPAGEAWTRRDGAIERIVECSSYAAATALVVRLALLFEEHGHHADLTWSWTTLTVTLRSHDAGTVTDRDHAMAAHIDEVLAS